MKKLFILATITICIAFVLYIKPKVSHPDHPVVGIVQIIEHKALDKTRLGFIEKLKNLGFENEQTVQILYESAQGNPALASQIVQKFVGQKVDVIVAIATTPAQAAVQNVLQMKENERIPIVFLSVSDPFGARLVDDIDGKLTSDLVCGISNYVDVKKQLTMFKQALPNILNLGIIYNPGEANSVTSIHRFQKWAPDFHINIVPVAATKTSDVIIAAQSLKGKVDAIFVDNDNTALAAFPTLSDFCEKNMIPLFVSDTDQADLALASLGPDQKRVGEQGAEFVALLLKKASRISDLGVQFPDKVELYINECFANKINVTLDPTFIKSAAHVISKH
jgi:putative ABC transport system substrate-binding protein